MRRRDRGKGGGRWAALMALFLCVGTTACAPNGTYTENNPSAGVSDTGFLPAVPGNYDSLDTAVLAGKNTENGTLRFYNTELGRFYTLNYDGATTYEDKYAGGLSLAQLKIGSLVDISFMRGRKRLNSLQVNGEAFIFSGVKDLNVTTDSRQVYLMGEDYTLDPKAVVLTENGAGELMDLNSADTLYITGVGHTIYSISVEKGHGYLRLENAEHFVGGFVQVGEKRVYQISQDMLLAVPEGSYDVTVSNKGSSGTEQISVQPGQEISLDVSKWVSAPKYGRVMFITVPEDAELLIDGQAVENGKEQTLSYGIHQLVAKADGYTTLSRYIRVASELAKLNVTLEEGSDGESSTSSNEVQAEETPTSTPTPTPEAVSANSASGNTASGNELAVPSTPTPTATDRPGNILVSEDGGSSTAVTAGEYRVYINAPEGVEVYKDGAYIGLSPISFVKQEGSCVVTLRKDGYQTRSYTIVMDGEAKDVNYSFSELLSLE